MKNKFELKKTSWQESIKGRMFISIENDFQGKPYLLIQMPATTKSALSLTAELKGKEMVQLAKNILKALKK